MHPWTGLLENALDAWTAKHHIGVWAGPVKQEATYSVAGNSVPPPPPPPLSGQDPQMKCLLGAAEAARGPRRVPGVVTGLSAASKP